MFRKSIFPIVHLFLFCSCLSSKPVTLEGKEKAVLTESPAPEEVVLSQVDTIPQEEEKIEAMTEPVTAAEEEKVVREVLRDPNVPEAEREFRAAWIATVANINWPSKPGLTSLEQQKEALEFLDFLQANNFNAVIFQVRPQTDAFYESDLEPWSYFLTGEQGKAPEPFYDPLHFWIEAAHDRGMELHAWLNPYRAHHSTGKEVTEKSIVRTKPDLVVQLQNKMWWMDPSKEATKKHSTDVVMDLVRRYDLDGIHFDDYFYPYAEYNGGKDFPDEKSWQAYKTAGGELSRGDWRREGVNSFISNLYKKIKAEKPNVKFGISPFGIWRPGHPESIKGFDQYAQLYADAKLWLNEGWIDYFTPQLYWPIGQVNQSFPVLLAWWEGENTQRRHLWPGINLGLAEKEPDEIVDQIMISRGILSESPGVVHWSLRSLLGDARLQKALVEGPYAKPALVPRTPWIDNDALQAPVTVAEILPESLKVTWVPSGEEEPFRYVVYYRYGKDWKYQIMNRKDTFLEIPLFMSGSNGDKTKVSAVAVTSVDQTGNESDFKEILIRELN